MSEKYGDESLWNDDPTLHQPKTNWWEVKFWICNNPSPKPKTFSVEMVDETALCALPEKEYPRFEIRPIHQPECEWELSKSRIIPWIDELDESTHITPAEFLEECGSKYCPECGRKLET